MMEAIERAQSLDANDVARALEASDFTDFMGRVRFDANHQNDLEMLVVQQPAGSATDLVVYPPAVATASLSYPFPPWRQRRCQAYGPEQARNVSAVGVRRTRECNGHGACSLDGACVCSVPWEGTACMVDSTIGGADQSTAIILTCVCAAILFLAISNALRLKQKNAVSARCSDAVACNRRVTAV